MAKKNATTTKTNTPKPERKAPTRPAKAATIAQVAEVELAAPDAPTPDAAQETPASGGTNAKRGRKHKSGITIVGEEPAEMAAAQAAEEGNAPAHKEKKAKAPKEPKAPKPPKVKRLSALDAAAQVLATSAKPMSATEMVEQMAVQGLWESPGGKTPEATLYAAVIREISAKGSDARFKKVDRGMFEYAGKGA